MADDWYYAQSNERKGPVPFAKLQSMAKSGWLATEDLVWQSGMPDWKPAWEVEGLHASSMATRLRKTIDGLRKPSMPAAEEPQQTAPPSIPEKKPTPARAAKRERPKSPAIDWDDLQPRHVMASCGGFLAALGIAFTAIAQSKLALAFTLSGLFLAGVGLYVEIGNLLGQAATNIGKASKEAADRRLRAKELAVEKQRLDLEAAKLAQEKSAREAASAPAAVLVNRSEGVPSGPAGEGQVVVINQPPVQRWSPGLAAVLSFFLPGLGQLYKGQIINGIVWFCFVCVGYLALVVPGLILHFFCVLGALSGNPWTEGKTTVVRQ
jgi:TM2 domain-containing membrane protein YozV